MRDSLATAVLCFSSPLGFRIVNEEEIVVSLRESAKLGLSNFIVEGDSWCVVHWALGSRPP